MGPASCKQDSYKADKARAIAVNGKGKEFARSRELNMQNYSEILFKLQGIPVKGKLYAFIWCTGYIQFRSQAVMLDILY